MVSIHVNDGSGILWELDLRNQAIGDAVGERHHDERDKGRNGVAVILPVDLLDLTNHGATNLKSRID